MNLNFLKMHCFFILLLYFDQVSPFNFAKFKNIIKDNNNFTNDFTQASTIIEDNDFTNVNVNYVNKVNNIIDDITKVNDNNFVNVTELSIPHWSNSEEKQTLGCQLICWDNSIKFADNLWECKWRLTKSHCHNVTREIMQNAEIDKTVDRGVPFLINVSSTPHFSIVFDSQISHHLEISNFQDGFSLDFPNLFRFLLFRNPLKKINAKMFEGADSLCYLQIIHCSLLSEIEDAAFENMTSLQELHLHYDALTKIDAATFGIMFSLTILNLANNSIMHIHEDAFINLPNLTALNLEANQINSLHSDTFKNQAKLKDLILRNNEIQYLPTEIFKNLINLKVIFLNGNPLSQVHMGLFNYSSRLAHTFLGCCPINGANNCKKSKMTIGKGGLSTRSLLNTIIITGCLDEAAFEGVFTKYLWIQHNEQFRKIIRNTFKGIRQIFYLYISNNNIETIENDSFQDVAFSKLIQLCLCFNRLKTIPDGTFSKLTQLRKLDLSFNLITTITPHIFAKLMSLTDLSLEGNQITQIQGDAFSSLNLLNNLMLRQNQINNLSSISFKGLQILETLDLSWNKLKMISYKDFDWASPIQSASLHTLYLHQNQIQKVEGFHLPLDLNLLDLSNNDISDLHGSFEALFIHGISKLILSGNRIVEIGSDGLQNIAKMKELFLDRNQVKDMSFIMKLRMVPDHLDISHNNITEVSSEIRKRLQMINYLNISHNPWKCDCDGTDRGLVHFLQDHNIISCCPNSCHCYSNADRSVFMNCSSQNQSSLPPCLPYEQIRLNYMNNIISTVSFTKDQENISFLDVCQNSITSIDGSSLKILTKLKVLNLESNLLHTLPKQMSQLSHTKIYVEGNEFFCDNCGLVNILQTVMQSAPQNITCAKKQSFLKESFICLVKFTIVPYSFPSFACVVLIILVYGTLKLAYIKRLRKSYKQKTVILRSKELIKAYKQECTLLREIDHQHILKMHKNMTTWVPFVKNVGHLFLERADYSLSEVIGQTVILAFPLSVHFLTVDLLSAIQYLHSREYPICHGQLSTNTVYLQQDISSKIIILKIGDLSLAKRFVPLGLVVESTSLASCSNDQTSYIRADLQAVAKIIFTLLTKKEKNEIVTKEEIMQLSEIEFGILILALQEGMSAAEALQAAPYHSAEQKKSILGELNAYLKMVKNAKKSAGILSEAEKNACLVIGGKGAWNKHLPLAVIEKFALLFNGYNITSFIDLLRLIRNMLEHGHECPKSMEAAFQASKPTPEKMFLEFSRKFPFFYLHSLLCYYDFFEERSHLVSKIFMTTYRSFEKSLCEDLLIQGSVLPLQEKSNIIIHYKSVSSDVKDTLIQDHIRSCIGINDIFPEIFQKITELWHDVSMAKVIFKHGDKFIQNPYTNASSTTPDYAVTSKQFVPEGSTIAVLKPELLVQLPDKVISMAFKPTDNVKAIKGLVMKHLTSASRKKINPQTISITLNDNPLKDKVKLMDLVNDTLTVNYSHVEI